MQAHLTILDPPAKFTGVLKVNCISGHKVEEKDFLSKSDPYLVCRVGTAPQTAVTKVIDGSLAPEWNETVTLNVPSLEDLLLVSRTIIAGIWVAFFQECQQ